MKQIKVIIDEISGEIKIETIGFNGPSCLEESKFLKDLIGETITKSLTPAYFTKGKVEIKKFLNICG